MSFIKTQKIIPWVNKIETWQYSQNEIGAENQKEAVYEKKIVTKIRGCHRQNWKICGLDS